MEYAPNPKITSSHREVNTSIELHRFCSLGNGIPANQYAGVEFIISQSEEGAARARPLRCVALQWKDMVALHKALGDFIAEGRSQGIGAQKAVQS